MRKKRTLITHVYLLNVEEPDDFYYKPEGIFFIDDQGHYTLYASDSRHNFLRSIIQKFPYGELEKGLNFRDHNVRIVDITAQFGNDFEMVLDDMLPILHRIYNSSPRQYFFMEKFFQPSTQNNYFVP